MPGSGNRRFWQSDVQAASMISVVLLNFWLSTSDS